MEWLVRFSISPVISNMGTDRGLPISCFGVDTPDSIRGIGLTNAELMKLTASGGGCRYFVISH